jgi:heme exporter protein C
VNVWRTLHPKTTVVPSLGPGMREPFWFSVLIFLLLFVALLALRLRLAAQQSELESLYRDLDEGSVGV